MLSAVMVTVKKVLLAPAYLFKVEQHGETIVEKNILTNDLSIT